MKIIVLEASCSLWIYYLMGGVLLTSALLYLLITSNWFKTIRLGLCLPGPRALPIIGNCTLAADSQGLLDLGDKAYEEYGPIFRIWISCIPLFIVLDPKDLQNVLTSSKNTNKMFFYSLMLNFLGTGLLTMSGYKWKKHRRLLQPSFNLNILETFIDCFSDSSACLIEKLETVTSNEKEINITTFINNSVLLILNEAILGIPVGQSSLENSPFRQGKVVSQYRIGKPWLLFDFIFNLTKSGKTENCQKKNVTSFTEQIIAMRKQERLNGIYKDRTSLLERMLDIQEENPEFTDEDIINEISTFMLAGQESVATTISFCLYFIAKHQHIQNLIFEEQRSIFSECDRAASLKDLQSMTYLEQCIKETLRLCPSVPLMARKLGESVQIGKHVLPEGSNVLISPYVTQRIAAIFPHSHVFDPERFNAENSEARPPFSFIPFSAGPRNCIGSKFAMLEMKTVISSLVRNFELVVRPEYELKIAFRITLRAKGGIWIKLKSRKVNTT